MTLYCVTFRKAVEEARARAEKIAAEKDAEAHKVQEVLHQSTGKDQKMLTFRPHLT